MAENMSNVETMAYDNLFAAMSQQALVAMPVKAKTVLKKGSLVELGSDGYVKLCGASTNDVYGVVTADINGSGSADGVGAVYINGEFNLSAVIVDSGSQASDFVEKARKANIVLR